MTLSNEQKSKIQAYKAMGYSSREIAFKVLGRKSRKSTVNDYLASGEFAIAKDHEKFKPRILCFDLETSVAIVAAFGRHKVFLGQDNIIEDGGKILCAGYRWLGDSSSQIVCQTPEEARENDDSRVVATLWDLFSQADAVVAHNGLSFDVPMLRARVIANDLPPLPVVKVLDTLQMAKRYFRFPNNKLDSLAAYFGLERKVDAGGVSTWINFQKGDKNAMSHMVDYCLHDTNLLHDIYIKLRSFGHASDFNAGLYTDGTKSACPSCGSARLIRTSRTIKTAVSVFNEMRCLDCGSVSRTRTPVNTKEQRKTIIVTPKASG